MKTKLLTLSLRYKKLNLITQRNIFISTLVFGKLCSHMEQFMLHLERFICRHRLMNTCNIFHEKRVEWKIHTEIGVVHSQEI